MAPVYPPSDAVGEPVDLRLVLGRSDSASVVIENVVAYPTGFAFQIVATHPPDAALHDRGLLGDGPGRRYWPDAAHGATQREERVALYLRLPDGRSMASEPSSHAGHDPSDAALRPYSAQASTSTIRASYWIEPLPPSGILTLACEWPIFGIALNTCSTETSPIVAAASGYSPEPWGIEGQPSQESDSPSEDFFAPLHEPPRRRPGETPPSVGGWPPQVHLASEVGEPVPIRFVLGRSDRATIRVRHMVAFSNGFQFEVIATYQPSAGRMGWDPMMGLAGLRGRPGDEYGHLSDEHLRLGIEFAGGGKASNVGPPVVEPSSSDPRTPSLKGIDGGADVGLVRAIFWVSPLPDPGPLVFRCEWPKYGVPLTRYQVDATSIREAGSRTPAQ